MDTDELIRVGQGKVATEPSKLLRVTIRQKVQREWMTEDVTWPEGWPLPEQGAVFQGHTLQGWIEHIEWNVVTQRVLIVLR